MDAVTFHYDAGPARRVRATGIVLAVLLAALHAWASRYQMTHDGLAYLDMSTAVLRGDWARAISGQWSPLYPWLLALTFALVRPGPRWEFPLVHAVNLALFLACLVCFDFFLRQLLAYRERVAGAGTAEQARRIPAWALVALGYAVFIWSSLNQIGPGFVAPDLAVTACVYLAAGWLLRVRMHPARWTAYAVLGLALGLGYLAKAPMFPLGLVLLAMAVFPVPTNLSLGQMIPRAGIALLVFALVSGTLVFGFYRTRGRLMLGDSAWLNYAWHVNRVPVLHYQGDRPGYGRLAHPTRRISSRPEAYEFAAPLDVTYPPWFDPAYWYEGLRPRFDPRGHLVTARWSLRFYRAEDALHHWLSSVVPLALLAAWLVGRRWLALRDLRPFVSLWGSAVAALALYAVIHLESRYVAPFVTLLWLAVACGVRLPSPRAAGAREAALVLAAALLVHLVPAAVLAGQQLNAIRTDMVLFDRSRPADVHWKVAEALGTMGLTRGGRVAVIGPGVRAYWARLAGVRVVAEVPAWATGDFWAADARSQQEIFDKFAEAGAEMVVVQPNFRLGPQDAPPPAVLGPEWRRIGSTDYYVLVLRK